MPSDLLRRLRADQPITEGWVGNLVDAVNLNAAAGNVFVDGTGVYHRPTRTTTQRKLRWGKLDGPMAAGGTQTVSLWQTTGGGWEGWDEDSGDNWDDVYAPPILPSGSLDSGNWVLVAEVNGRRVVLLTEC